MFGRHNCAVAAFLSKIRRKCDPLGVILKSPSAKGPNAAIDMFVNEDTSLHISKNLPQVQVCFTDY